MISILRESNCLVSRRSSETNLFAVTNDKSSLYSLYYIEACIDCRGLFWRLSAWTTQIRKDVTAVASHWRHCVRLTWPGIAPQTTRTDAMCSTTTQPTTQKFLNRNFYHKLPSKFIRLGLKSKGSGKVSSEHSKLVLESLRKNLFAYQKRISELQVSCVTVQ